MLQYELLKKCPYSYKDIFLNHEYIKYILKLPIYLLLSLDLFFCIFYSYLPRFFNVLFSQQQVAYIYIYFQELHLMDIKIH
jgi:hypothetical protein